MRAFGSTLVILLLLAGLALIGYARWTNAIDEADSALAEGRLDHAITGYAAAETRFDSIPAVRQLAAAEYTRVFGN
ncbi:MAG TPA: hypothetical protein VFZ98_05710, partial [Vicinamibacterales bacterium]